MTVLARLPLPEPHARCPTPRYGFAPDGLTDAPSVIARIGEVVRTCMADMSGYDRITCAAPKTLRPLL
ncbi:hypothetical protein [Streptomyces sp. NPDC058457]|uniref:hypothetical protein n=1 Tax=Streptomyces sp. NPDC058457 TaxID=3346507 RepID=UPI0036543661